MSWRWLLVGAAALVLGFVATRSFSPAPRKHRSPGLPATATELAPATNRPAPDPARDMLASDPACDPHARHDPGADPHARHDPGADPHARHDPGPSPDSSAPGIALYGAAELRTVAPAQLQLAEQAFGARDFQRALAVAQGIATSHPASSTAHRVAALSACALDLPDVARRHASRVTTTDDREEIRRYCAHHDVPLEIDAPASPALPSPSARDDASSTMP